VAGAIKLEISAVDRASVLYDAVEVTIPGAMGPFTILPGHAPLLSNLDIGLLTAKLEDGPNLVYAINGGFVQVRDDHVLVLAQTAELDTEIDLARAETARDRAEARLREPDHTIDLARAEIALKRALLRIKVAREVSPPGTIDTSRRPE